jgi:hypothetical protein
MGIAAGLARKYATVLTAALLAPGLTASAAGRARPEYPPPAALAPVTAATLQARYETNSRQIERARRIAEGAGDHERARTLARLARPGRRFLGFDPRGDGQAVEVLGDIARARTVAIVIPGSDQDLETFDGRGSRPYDAPGGGARALRAQAHRDGADIAVIAWLGYRPPSTFSPDVALPERAERGARELRRLIGEVRRINGAGPATAPSGPSAAGRAGAALPRVSLLCHSYGSAVCARAVRGLPVGAPAERQVDELIAFGSPGMGVGSAAEIGGGARVWAARGDRDWIDVVPNLRVLGVGHGADPVAPGFGARVFDAGAAGHGEYLAPGSPSLRNLTRIVIGRTSELEVTRG